METIESSFHCPHCSVYAQFNLKRSEIIFSNDEFEIGDAVEYGFCPNCRRIVIYVVEVFGKLLDYNVPSEVNPFQKSLAFPGRNRLVNEDAVPKMYLQDYKEAIKVLPFSPNSSAILIRRMLESILKTEYGIQERTLYDAITKFLKVDGIPFYIRDAADAIRNLGNLAAHQTFNNDKSRIVQVEKYEVEWLLDVIEALFDFTFIQPEILRQRTEKLNSKLKEAGKEPLRTGNYE